VSSYPLAYNQTPGTNFAIARIGAVNRVGKK
jgi:hypothetical protein